MQLPTSEQEAYLAFEYQRCANIRETISRIFAADDKPVAEIITARILVELLQHI